MTVRSPFLKSVFSFILISLLSLMFSLGLASKALGQFSDLLGTNQSTQSQSSIDYQRVGNIDIANVNLDGRPIFQVAAPIKSGSDDTSELLPIELRVREIEYHLNEVVQAEIHPQSLKVYSSILNNQVVIYVEDQETTVKRKILTLTELDQFTEFKTFSDLTDARVSKIRTALHRAWDERQPQYLNKQLDRAVKVLAVTVVLSLILLACQKRLRIRCKQLKQQLKAVSTEDARKSSVKTDQRKNGILENFVVVPMVKTGQWLATKSSQAVQIKLQHLFGGVISQSSHFLAYQLPHLTLTQRQNINHFFRSLLWWTQVTLWLLGFTLAFWNFPETRKIARWLFEVPFELLGIFLLVGIGLRVVDITIHHFLKGWAERQMQVPEKAQRISYRIPTITQALQEITATTAVIIGFVLFLSWARTPVVPIVTSLGLIGFAGQNLIKDWLRGCLILWEDQYAIGDFISIDEVTGLVEYMSLRITRLRTHDGELVTIDHGSFTQVKNFTSQWSRVNMGIDIAYDSNIDQAINIIQNVASDLCVDPLWEQYIIGPPLVLGVDHFGDNSITIRLWIKTKPLKQWNVAREYRRRLKPELDAAGISIPFPQRSIWFENAMPHPPSSFSQVDSKQAVNGKHV